MSCSRGVLVETALKTRIVLYAVKKSAYRNVGTGRLAWRRATRTGRSRSDLATNDLRLLRLRSAHQCVHEVVIESGGAYKTFLATSPLSVHYLRTGCGLAAAAGFAALTLSTAGGDFVVVVGLGMLIPGEMAPLPDGLLAVAVLTVIEPGAGRRLIAVGIVDVPSSAPSSRPENEEFSNRITVTRKCPPITTVQWCSDGRYC